MKKLIALLLTIASMFSFFILFNNEKREQQSNMEIAEKNLKYNIRIMIPTKIDSNNADDMLKGIKDTLDKYNASIYYKRLNKGDEVQTEYIYINDDEYLSKFEATKGRILQKEDMNTNLFVSTKNSQMDNQIGTLATFCNKNVFEIYTLNTMIEKGYSLGGECYISFNKKINEDNFIKDLEEAIKTPGVKIIQDQNIHVNNELNIWIIILFYFIVILLVLYDLLKSYKEVGIEKLLGNSNWSIYIKKIFGFAKLYLFTTIISDIILIIIKFDNFNKYVINFIFRLIYMNFMLGIVFLIMTSIPLIYINKVNIVDMLKNKKLTMEILIFNFTVKILIVIALGFIVNQGIVNFDRIKNVFSNSFKQWDDVDNYAIIPQLINIESPEIIDSYQYQKNQKELYDYFNDKGAILANFSEYSPGIRKIRESETSFDYERNNITVNPNYLDKYPIYDINGERINISENEKSYIVLIPETYKKYEQDILKLFSKWKEAQFGATSVDQPNKIIWTKSNQKLFSMQIDINPNDNNYVKDPIVHVMTKNNASLADYNVVLGISDSPFKIRVEDSKNPENTIMPVLQQYGYDKYVEKILCINEQIASESKSVKDTIQGLVISIFVTISCLVIVIIQNICNFFDKYNKVIAIKKMNGFTMWDKYKKYFCISLLSLLISSCILLIKVPIKIVLGMLVLEIFIEFLFTILILLIIENKKVISVIKEGI